VTDVQLTTSTIKRDGQAESLLGRCPARHGGHQRRGLRVGTPVRIPAGRMA
jgi:hypothetical protein